MHKPTEVHKTGAPPPPRSPTPRTDMPTITVYDDAPVITTTSAGRRFPADYGRLADCWDLAWAALQRRVGRRLGAGAALGPAGRCRSRHRREPSAGRPEVRAAGSTA